MAKKPPKLRVDSKTQTEYNSLMKRAKSKVARTRKKYGVDLSGEIELPSITSFNSRKDFNEWKDQAESFTSRYNTKYQFKKNEKGVVASKQYLNQIERDTNRARNIAKELIAKVENKEIKVAGKPQGVTVGQQSKLLSRPNIANVVVPPKFKFKDIQDKKQLDKKAENMKDRASSKFHDKRMSIMRDNYADMLSLSFHNWADELADRIRDLPPDIFFEMYTQNDEFDFSQWDSEGQYVGGDDGDVSEAEGKVNQMMGYIDQYYAGKMKLDLKHDHFS